MSAIDLGSLGSTVVVEVTSSPVTFENEAGRSSYLLYATVNCHAAVDAAANTEGAFIAEATYFRITLTRGQVLSLIVADGETDGNVYVMGV